MEPSADPVHALPIRGVACGAHSEPNIEAMVELLGDEMQRHYRRCLAEEVRAAPSCSRLPACLRALTRASARSRRCNRARHPECWPR